MHKIMAKSYLKNRGISVLVTSLAVASVSFATLTVGGPAGAVTGERALDGVRVFVKVSALEQKLGAAPSVLEGAKSESLLVPGPVADDLCGAAGTGGTTAGSSGGYPGGGYPGGGYPGGGYPGGAGSSRGGSASEFGGGSSANMAQMYGRMSGAGGGSGYGAASAGSADKADLKTWVYDQSDGSGSTDFLVSQGRVIQIHVHGFHSSARTSRGIHLGSTMENVHNAYGSPDSTNTVGEIINDNYSKSDHCAFQYYKGKVVGLIVAASD